MKRLLNNLVALAMVTCVTTIATTSTAQTATRPEGVTIGYLNLVNAQLLSKALGYHEKAMGVPVKWVRFDTGGQVNNAFAAKQLDFGSMGNPPAATGVSRDMPYQAVVVLNMLESVEGLVVKADKNIQSPKDLVGKRFAMPFGSTAYYVSMSMLRDAKIDPASVTLVDMNPADALEAWKRGDIDAAYVWEPSLDKMVTSGGRMLVDSKEMGARGLATWDISAVTTSFAQNHPALVKAFVQSECAAIDFWIRDPEAAAVLVARELSIPLADAKRMMKGTGMVPCTQQTGPNYFGTTAAKGRFADSLVDIAAFFKSTGRLTSIKDREAYADFINPSYLEQLNAR
ncbi:MAG: ABC transporter substrate-binding protein [Variovorax sp.]